jgi:hypothetical protein
MRQWQLPGSMREAAEFHVEPLRAVEFPLETSLVHIASLLVEAAETGQEFGSEALQPHPESWNITGLSLQQCRSVQQESEAEADRVLELFLPRPQAVND